MNVKSILEGYWRLVEKNSGIIDEVRKQEGELRFSICSSCDQLNKESHKCGLCGCYMPAKVLVMNERCPQLLWREKKMDRGATPQPAL